MWGPKDQGTGDLETLNFAFRSLYGRYQETWMLLPNIIPLESPIHPLYISLCLWRFTALRSSLNYISACKNIQIHLSGSLSMLSSWLWLVKQPGLNTSHGAFPVLSCLHPAAPVPCSTYEYLGNRVASWKGFI